MVTESFQTIGGPRGLWVILAQVAFGFTKVSSVLGVRCLDCIHSAMAGLSDNYGKDCKWFLFEENISDFCSSIIIFMKFSRYVCAAGLLYSRFLAGGTDSCALLTRLVQI